VRSWTGQDGRGKKKRRRENNFHCSLSAGPRGGYRGGKKWKEKERKRGSSKQTASRTPARKGRGFGEDQEPITRHQTTQTPNPTGGQKTHPPRGGKKKEPPGRSETHPSYRKKKAERKKGEQGNPKLEKHEKQSPGEPRAPLKTGEARRSQGGEY